MTNTTLPNQMLYISRDKRYWIELKSNELYRGCKIYRAQLGHVITELYYPNDEEAIKSVKKSKAKERA